MNILNISQQTSYDNSIESFEYHSYKPYVTSFNKNDEIRIPINQQDLYVLPSLSSLYIEGKVVVYNSTTKEKVSNVHFVNNPGLFLFQDIRYELNGVEIDKIKNAGITTTMKSYLSLNENESKCGRVWGWSTAGTNNTSGGAFSASIPLNRILGFAEDYEKIIINCKHELVLLRSNTNLNAVKLNAGEVVDDIIINKIIWRVPHIKVSDRERINLLKHLEKDRAIPLVFRNWDLYEYPLLPKTRKHTWSIKTSSQIEKPRFVVIALQTNRKHNAVLSMAEFDHCHVRDVRVFLNSTYYPYEGLNVSFSEEKIALLYEQYSRFQQSYHGRRSEPLLSLKEFRDVAPLFVIDCSRQHETLKGSIDVRVEIETDQEIPDQTAAYCLILNDCIFEYKPLSNIVKKIS
ncbi:uncharacterized protein LOC114365372 isoform X2 [Ostrinia furnacalis]|uniref:uncharacterized protein LOC114365372 isoform X1 n=1 Tax=Ostrinia furnacalis TaxID=93504 RepID=UPI001039496C|nr:uncharacterized protein LOC114365372 isoform X1 [Ostrinia furnacalis]XP_028177726.1 uncharacterized protein LOC114365372 isoform X2 [Ostrinia furnacalis]